MVLMIAKYFNLKERNNRIIGKDLVVVVVNFLNYF